MNCCDIHFFYANLLGCYIIYEIKNVASLANFVFFEFSQATINIVKSPHDNDMVIIQTWKP
jgi:hypothetical protein